MPRSYFGTRLTMAISIPSSLAIVQMAFLLTSPLQENIDPCSNLHCVVLPQLTLVRLFTVGYIGGTVATVLIYIWVVCLHGNLLVLECYF